MKHTLNSDPAAARRLISQSVIESVADGSSMAILAFSLYRVGCIVALLANVAALGEGRPP